MNNLMLGTVNPSIWKMYIPYFQNLFPSIQFELYLVWQTLRVSVWLVTCLSRMHKSIQDYILYFKPYASLEFVQFPIKETHITLILLLNTWNCTLMNYEIRDRPRRQFLLCIEQMSLPRSSIDPSIKLTAVWQSEPAPSSLGRDYWLQKEEKEHATRRVKWGECYVSYLNGGEMREPITLLSPILMNLSFFLWGSLLLPDILQWEGYLQNCTKLRKKWQFLVIYLLFDKIFFSFFALMRSK